MNPVLMTPNSYCLSFQELILIPQRALWNWKAYSSEVEQVRCLQQFGSGRRCICGFSIQGLAEGAIRIVLREAR